MKNHSLISFFLMTLIVFYAAISYPAVADETGKKQYIFTDDKQLSRDYSGISPIIPVTPAILDNDSVKWESLGDGMKRKVFFNDRLTVVILQIERPVKPDEIMKCHYHAHDQITYVLEGRLKVNINGLIKEISQGGCYIIPSNIHHGIIPSSERVSILDIFTPTREDFRPSQAIQKTL